MRTANIWSAAWADTPAVRSSSVASTDLFRVVCDMMDLRPGDRRKGDSRRSLRNGLSGFERECFGNIASLGAVLRSSCMGEARIRPGDRREGAVRYVGPEPPAA